MYEQSMINSDQSLCEIHTEGSTIFPYINSRCNIINNLDDSSNNYA